MFSRGSVTSAIADRVDARGATTFDRIDTRIDTVADEATRSIRQAAEAWESAALVIAIVAVAIGLAVVGRQIIR